MRFGKFGARLGSATSKRAFAARKYVHQHLTALRSHEPRRLLFILGCQRSGTSLMQWAFEKDLDVKAYHEYSEISGPEEGKHIRLQPLDKVRAILDRDRARLIVAKPLVETQNAHSLLSYFREAKAVFLYRNHAAVAASNLKTFGVRNGINNLRPIVDGDTANWRAEGVPPDVRELVTARFREDMKPHDAAALFWYVRNRFFFDLGLDRHPSVMLLRYEDLVREPVRMLQRVYRFTGMNSEAVGASLVHGESIGKGQDIELSEDVRDLCAGLLERLHAVNAMSLAAEAVDGHARRAESQPRKRA